jgi:hypothetical protein
MDADQDWCLQCGAGTPGSLQADSHHWRSTAAVLSAVALLVAGAAAAAYAALSKSSAKPRAALATVAQTPAPPAGAPGAAATLPPTATATPTPATPKPGAPVKPHLPPVKTPKIPLSGGATKSPAATSPATTTPAGAGTTTTPSASTKTSTGGGSTTTKKQPAAIVLDTNAASTYNPYNYPASSFGDPSLAVDGETSTGWSAKVDPSVAPKMAEGLLIDLKTAQRLSALVLTTSTPGMTVQVYGSASHAAPSSITDPAWLRLSGVLVEKKRSQRIPLADSKHALRFVTLWISAAPASSVGTPAHPGHVSVNEIELFPAR